MRATARRCDVSRILADGEHVLQQREDVVLVAHFGEDMQEVVDLGAAYVALGCHGHPSILLRIRPYSTDSTSAFHEASRTFSETAMVPNDPYLSDVVMVTRVMAPVPWLSSSSRTL